MDNLRYAPIITHEPIQKESVFKAVVESNPVAWYCLLNSTPTAILDDLWVLPAFMGLGIGRTLFEHAISQAGTAQAIELDADPNAVPFYQRMGCVVIGETLTEWNRYVPRMRYLIPIKQ